MQSWYLGANARLSIPGQGSVNAELWERFVAGCDAHHTDTGQRTQINSVMRSTVDQQRFWSAYVRYLQGGAWAPLAARPGTSNHERGTAIDAQPAGGLAVTGSAWQRAMTARGLHFPVNGEPWHAELAPARRPLPAPPTPPQEETVLISEVQMTQLKQHMEQVVLRVLPRDHLATMQAEVKATFLAIFPGGSVNEPNRLDRIEQRLDRIEKRIG